MSKELSFPQVPSSLPSSSLPSSLPSPPLASSPLPSLHPSPSFLPDSEVYLLLPPCDVYKNNKAIEVVIVELKDSGKAIDWLLQERKDEENKERSSKRHKKVAEDGTIEGQEKKEEEKTKEGIVGLDTESVNGRPVLMQISVEERCVIVRIPSSSSPLFSFPPSLENLLKDPKVIKVGAGLFKDALGLYKSYNWILNGIFDFHFHDTFTLSLAQSFSSLFHFSWEKEIVNHKKWNVKQLSPTQIKYAALDAWASYAVGLYELQKCHQIILHLSPIPPRILKGKYKQVCEAISKTRECKSYSQEH